MVNNKINSKPDEDDASNIEKFEKPQSKNDWSMSRIFWGLLFVIVGGLALFDNLGIVDVNWGDTWRLWPLIIIAAGASILSVKHVVWRIVSTILVVMMLWAIIWVMVGDYSDYRIINSTTTTTQIKSDKVTNAEVNIKASAITLNIGSNDQTAIVKSTMESNVASISERTSITDGTQVVDLAMSAKRSVHWWTNSIKSEWDVDLNRNLPIKLSVDTGASDTDANLSDVKLTSANIKIGASNLRLKIGKKTDNVDVNIDSGVSSIIIKVPNDSGVRLKLDSGLTSRQLADLKATGENIYESSDYVNTMNKINITAKVGVSSFTIERY